mmetsp:Transcript_118389/g.235811  ORF Transcript_118389/g.235811 Transcript_118389/m.235811 type:complete len:302 (-) Transcript_118389:137-1042(-)
MKFFGRCMRQERKPALFLSTRPPSVKESEALAEGLMLDGKMLAPPQFHPVNWFEGQKFTEIDDPDRTQEPFLTPSFVQHKDPLKQQDKTWAEELPILMDNSFARVVYGLLDETDCAELIDCINRKGFTPALLNIGRGRQKLEPSIRNGHRVIVDSGEVSAWILRVLEPYLPERLWGGNLVDLNERLRFLCYTPGQEFAMHCDGRYHRPRGHPRAGDFSMVTVQIYLHDVPPSHGGATTFDLGGRQGLLPCQPKAGSALLFTQDLEHEGSVLLKGLKYTVRTEAMYGRIDDKCAHDDSAPFE